VAGRELTSIRSPRVKAAQRLTKRAFRRRDRRFLAEGPQAIREALALAGERAGGLGGGPSEGREEYLVELFATAEAEARHRELVAAADSRGIPVHRVSTTLMAELAQTVTPQGLLGVCRFVDVSLKTALAGAPRLVTVLAQVRDPGNAGTVLRTADAAGAQAVAFTDASVDPYNGKCVRASAGSLFHLPIVAGPGIVEIVDTLRAAGLAVIAADGSGERSLDEAADSGLLSSPVAWVFGNEAWGLPEGVRALAEHVVRVPLYGRAESLNLATAAAVCLYATARAQRRVPADPGGR
jgi:TrmH family RNA methyltransferase